MNRYQYVVWALSLLVSFVVHCQREDIRQFSSSHDSVFDSSKKYDKISRNLTSVKKNDVSEVGNRKQLEEQHISSLSHHIDRKLRTVEDALDGFSIFLPESSLKQVLTIPFDGSNIEVSVTLDASNLQIFKIGVEQFHIQLNANLSFVTAPNYEKPLNASFLVENAKGTIPLSEAINGELFEKLSLGTLLQLDDFFPCLLYDGHSSQNPIIILSGDHIWEPVVDSGQIIATNLDEVIISYVGDTLLRSLVIDIIASYIDDASCPELIAAASYLDFREFFLSAEEAKYLGATGSQPYGSGGQIVYSLLAQQFLSDDDDYLIGINSFAIDPFTMSNSGIEGKFNFNYSGFFDTKVSTSNEILNRFRAKLGWYDFQIENLDSLITPTKLFQPINKAHSIENILRFRDLTASFTVMANFEANSINYTKQNEFTLSLSFKDVDILSDVIAVVPTAELLDFPFNDLLNFDCWLALISSGADQYSEGNKTANIGAKLDSFLLQIAELFLGVECLNCTSLAISNTLPQIIVILTESQVTKTWSRRMELLIKEIMLSNNTGEGINQNLYQYRQFCPHRKEYDANLSGSHEFIFGTPELSNHSIDTLIFTCLIVFQIMFTLFADIMEEINDEVGEASSYFSSGETNFTSEKAFMQPTITGSQQSQIIDLYALSNGTNPNQIIDLDSVSNSLDELLIQLLSETSFFYERLGDVLITFLLLEDGTSTLFLNKTQQIGFLDMEISLDKIKINGLDRISGLSLYNPINSQTFKNEIKMEDLSISLSMSFGSSFTADPTQNITVFAGIKELDISMPIFMALDQNKLGSLQLGSLLRYEDAFQCIPSAAYGIHFLDAIIEVDNNIEFSVKGLMHDTASSLSSLIEVMYRDMPEKVNVVTNSVFNIFIRDFINELIEASISTSSCRDPIDNLFPQFVDFREMFQIDDFEPFEGKENPYGDIFNSFKNALDQNLFSTNEFGMSKINYYLLDPLTYIQSGEVGTVIYPDAQFELNTTRILFDRIFISLYNLQIDNINTVGVPMEVFEPKNADGFLLGNRLSIGVGPEPFRLSIRLSLRIEDQSIQDWDIYTSNKVQLHFELFDFTMFNVLAAKIRTQSLYEFPLRNFLEPSCWAYLFSTGNSNQAVTLEDIGYFFSNIRMKMTCIACDSQLLETFPSVLTELQNVFRFIFKRLGNTVVQMLSHYINTGLMNRDLLSFAESCHNSEDLQDSAEHVNKLKKSESDKNDEDYTLFNDGLLLSQESLESLTFVSLSIIEFFLYFIGEKLNEVVVPMRDPTYGEKRLDAAQNLTLVNFMSDDTEIKFVLSIIRLFNSYLSSSVNTSEGNVDMYINVLLEKMFSYGETRVIINKALQADLWSVEFNDLYLLGLDSFNMLSICDFTSNQTFDTRMGFKKLIFELHILVKTQIGIIGGSPVNVSYPFTAAISFEDINILSSLHVAIDKNRLGNMQLGNFLNLKEFFPCLFNISRAIEFTRMNAIAQNVSFLQVDGYMSDEVDTAYKYLSSTLERHYAHLLTNATPVLSDVHFRKWLNDGMISYDRYYSICTSRIYRNDTFIDFHDLLLSETDSRVYGGSGLAPYGLGIHQILRLFNLFLEVDPNTGISSLNTFLFKSSERPLFPNEVEKGVFHFPGEVLNLHKDISLMDIGFSVSMNISDLHVQNLGIGRPFSILDLTRNSPFLLNNTVSLGIEGIPVNFGSEVTIGFKLRDGIEIFNKFNLNLSLHSATIVLNGFLKIAEQKFMGLPLSEFSNFDCWLAIIQAPSILNKYGVREDDSEPNASITRLFLMLEKVEAKISCFFEKCSSPGFMKLEEVLPSSDASEEITNLINLFFHNASSKIGGQLAQDYIDLSIYEAARRCPVSPEFDPNFERIKYEPIENDEFFRSSLFNPKNIDLFRVSLSVASCFLIVITIGIIIKGRAGKFNLKWMSKLSRQELQMLQLKEKMRCKVEHEVNMISNSMFHSLEIPHYIRYAMPLIILCNVILFLVGHLHKGGTVDLNFDFMGESFSVKDFFTFTLGLSNFGIWEAGSKYIAVPTLFFSIFWPYLKLLVTFVAWFLPPRLLSTGTRGSIFWGLEVSGKWAMIDIMVMIVTMVGVRLSIRTPRLDFLPEDIFLVDILIVPMSGLYSNLCAQLVSQTSTHIIFHYHRKTIEHARKNLKHKRNIRSPSTTMVMQKVASMEGFEREESPLQEEGKVPLNIVETKDRLSSHAFVNPQGDASDKLVTRHYVNVLLVILVMVLFVLAISSCSFASISFETTGFAAAFNLYDTSDSYSGFDMARTLKSGIHGSLFFSSFFLFCLLVAPILQVLALVFLWFSNSTRQQKRKILAFTKILQSWGSSDVYLFAVLVEVWHLEKASTIALKEICNNFEEPIALLVRYGFLEQEDAYCFQRVAQVEAGAYIMIPFSFLLFFLNRFVTNAVEQYFWEKGEGDDILPKESDELGKHLALCSGKIEDLEPFPVLFTDTFRWMLCHEFELWSSEWYSPGLDDDIGKLALEESELDNRNSFEHHLAVDAEIDSVIMK